MPDDDDATSAGIALVM